MELLKKIDIHVHGYRYAYDDNHILPEQICEIYDKIGVERGVLMTVSSPEGALYTQTNEDVAYIAKKHSERFSWFCNIDPRIDNNYPGTDFTFLLEHYKALGARGVGEITANLYFDDPRVMSLFRACEACDMPVIFHMGNSDGDYGLIDGFGLPKLEKVLKAFPRLKLLGHSQRFWSHISGDVNEVTMHGWPEGKVTDGGRISELMRKYPNLYGDLSAFSGYNALARDPEFAYTFLEEFSDRLLFGTDVSSPIHIDRPMLKLASFLDEAVINGRISYGAYKSISRGNAEKILFK
ncbi:MAG: amidohydrolase family protein [Clostridia bacterium]|nr:amidohydrolase family protein [Clostridia bacterium]